MPRKKRNLQGEQMRPVTLKLRAAVMDKLEALVPLNGSLVETVEYMTELCFKQRRMSISERDEQHNQK